MKSLFKVSFVILMIGICFFLNHPSVNANGHDIDDASKVLGLWDIQMDGLIPHTSITGKIGIIRGIGNVIIRGHAMNNNKKFEGIGIVDGNTFKMDFDIYTSDTYTSTYKLTGRITATLNISSNGSTRSGNLLKVTQDPKPRPKEQEINKGLFHMKKVIITKEELKKVL